MSYEDKREKREGRGEEGRKRSKTEGDEVG